MAMDAARRLAYLHAMGIETWVPRRDGARPAPTGTPDQVPPVAPEPAPRAVATPLPPDPAEPSSPPFDDAWADTWEPVWEPEVETPPQPAPAAHPKIPPSAATPTVPTGRTPDPAALDWDALAAAVAVCRACSLCETRTRTVFGVGDRGARLLVIGEAPGADEDRAGEPFVGRAGQLLNRMLAAIGLAREQVYIANILKCRPPGNRDPRPDEIARCQGYLARQIALIAPRVILTVGRISAQTLIGTETPVGRLRGRWFAFGPSAIPLRVTYHPAYLLRSPEQKAKAWEDLVAVAHRLATP
jgi:uracil-DNA glycosylase